MKGVQNHCIYCGQRSRLVCKNCNEKLKLIRKIQSAVGIVAKQNKYYAAGYNKGYNDGSRHRWEVNQHE